MTYPPILSRRAWNTALALGVVVIGACHDRQATVPGAVRDEPRAVVPQLSVKRDGAYATVTVSASLRGDIGLLGSFTARLAFDTTALTFEGEMPVGDGTLRAFNAKSGLLRIAGAGATGIDPARLAVFRFAVSDASALDRLTLQFDELHATSQADAAKFVQRTANIRMVP